MILELSSFDNAILRLDEGIQRYAKDITDSQIRDGLIHRFELTYALSHKMLKRFLESTSPNPAEIDELAFQDLIRTGNEQGLLLSDWAHWKKYREMRARTSLKPFLNQTCPGKWTWLTGTVFHPNFKKSFKRITKSFKPPRPTNPANNPRNRCCAKAWPTQPVHLKKSIRFARQFLPGNLLSSPACAQWFE